MEANLIGSYFGEADLSRANLKDVDLSEANLSRADLRESDLIGADLRKTNLSEANLRDANLSKANLTGAKLYKSNLYRSNFTDANLGNTILKGANFDNTTLKDSDFTGSHLDSNNCFDSCDLTFCNIKEDVFNKHMANNEQYIWHGGKIIPRLEYTPKNNIILRSIEFPPEYRQAGISILNYFSEVLHKKYPKDQVSVTIKQEDLKVTMIIKTADGQKEKIEKELEQYGLVVTRNLTPEEYLSDPMDALILKQELKFANMRVENTKEIMYTERKHYESRISSLEKTVDALIHSRPPINVTNEASATSKANIHVTISQADKDILDQIADRVLQNKIGTELTQDQEEILKSCAQVVKAEINKPKPSFLGIKDNLQSINNILQGVGTNILASQIQPMVSDLLSKWL